MGHIMKKQILNYIFIVLVGILNASPGDASAVFLLISPGASSVATGEAQVAKADDAYATFFNPAGLAFQTGEEYVGMHVNWLPGLADDIYYEFLAYKKHIPWLGTVGGNVTFLNLGEQAGMDEFQNSTGTFSSYMWSVSASYGSKINETSGWGTNFKLVHQKLADRVTAGESGKPYSTDFAFDIGYLKKFDRLNLGLSISNIGPEVDFLDEQQADPMPTTMRMGIFSNVFSNETLKLNVLFDANKMLVARYEQMDWNGNGIIDSGKEQGFVDPWYEALYTSWLDDWYYGGDRNFSDADDTVDGQHIIGGYEFNQALFDTGAYDSDDSALYTPTLAVNTDSDNSEIQIVNGTPISVPTYDPAEGDTFLDFGHQDYGIYNSDGVKEKGSGDERKFSTELEDMVYSLGFELWYTDNFVFRAGYLHDQEGSLKHPTLGAGIKFGQYGFDLGYILGEKGEPRSNTLLFSVNLDMGNDISGSEVEVIE